MKRYILIAEEGERGLISKALEEQFLSDVWAEAEVLVTGVGGINIIHALRDLPRDAEILNIGYAGSANFDIGTWVAVTEVRLNHPNVKYNEPLLKVQRDNVQCTKGIQEAVCYTNCDFVLASDYKDCVFDMELAFIASFGFARLHSLKYVSDNLSLHAYHNLTNGVE